MSLQSSPTGSSLPRARADEARNPSPLLVPWPARMVHAAAFQIAGALIGRRFTAALREMDLAQWLPAEQLQARSEARLSALLRHAAENVPFYRETYQRMGMAPDALRTVAELQCLPVVSKAVFRSRPEDQFLAENVPLHRRLAWTTSGSTGEPFKFYLDRLAMPVVFASHLFYDSWFGLRPSDRYVRIMTPAVSVSPPVDTPWVARLRYAITQRLQALYESRTQERISVWEVDGDRVEAIYRRIEAFRPAYVLGYTSTLATVADELLARNLRLSHPIRGVITIAETLTPTRRRLIEHYFEAPIFNRYGQREFKYWSAQSCSESPEQFHVNTELVVWEIVREDGTLAAPGEVGRLVLTDLHNYVMPFIRYNTGDLAVAAVNGACACGRGFPVMEQLHGRSLECVRTPSGKTIVPVVLGQYLFVTHNYVDAIRHYQLVQEAPDRVRLLVVPDTGFDAALGERLQRDMARLMGEDVTVTVQTVSEITAERSGKRPIIKQMAGAHQRDGQALSGS